MKLRRLLAAPLLAAVVMATGCTNDTDEKESNTTPLPATDVNARPADQLVSGGELRLPVATLGASHNPMSSESTDDADEFRRAFLPTFFNYDAAGVAQPNTDFLESASETSSSPTVVSLKFNQRAAWGDGQPLTAADLIATWKACNGQSQGFSCSPDLRFNEISKVEQGSDEGEAIVTFNSAQPQWRHVFDRVSMLRADSVANPQVFNDGWDSEIKKEWTAGPFTISSASSKAVVLQPNQSWWGSDPKLGRLSAVAIPEENQLQAWRNNEIDVFDVGTSSQQYAEAKKVTDSTIRRSSATDFRELLFNTQSDSPISEEPVRQAIALSLNRSGIGQTDYPDIDFAPAPLGNRVLLTDQFGYVDNAAGTELANDTDRARKVLDEAGWKESDGTRSKDGRPLVVSFSAVQGVAASENEAVKLTEQLAKVGIKVETRTIGVNEFDNRSVLSGGDFDMIAITNSGSTDPYSDLRQRVGSGEEHNYSRLDAPDVDTALDQLASETDPNRQADIANQIDRQLWTKGYSVPLFQLPELTATKTRLANYGSLGLSTVNWTQVGFVKG